MILLPSQRLRLLQVRVVAFSRDRPRLRQRGQAQTITDRLLTLVVSLAIARRHHPIRKGFVAALERSGKTCVRTLGLLSRQGSQGEKEVEDLAAHRVSVTVGVMGMRHRHRRLIPVERGKDHALLMR